MRWWIAISVLAMSFSPLHAYQATSAGRATFTQPFSQPAKSVVKDNPARRVLLKKIDAEIARYEREGNKKKVAELKKNRASIAAASTDEEIAVWARKLNPPKEATKKPVPVIGDAKVVQTPTQPVVATTAQGAKTVASTSQSVADNGTDAEGFQSLFDGGSRKTDAPAKDDLRDALGPVVQAPVQSPSPQLRVPSVGVGREVGTPQDYFRPQRRPMETEAPPHPDTKRDMAKPASLPELEVLARQNGIPVEIFRQAYAEARRQNVDYRLVLAVMKQESAFKPTAKSHAGARGLMQVMPATGRDLGVKDANMLYDIKTSIYAGTKYIRQMWSMFVNKGAAMVKSFDSREVARVKSAIAAYNAGPGNVRKAGGVPNFKETKGYVVKVLGNYYSYMDKFPPAIS